MSGSGALDINRVRAFTQQELSRQAQLQQEISSAQAQTFNMVMMMQMYKPAPSFGPSTSSAGKEDITRELRSQIRSSEEKIKKEKIEIEELLSEMSALPFVLRLVNAITCPG